MKISEVEKEMEKGIFSEELFLEFQTALKRVPKNNRCQHCIISAAYLMNKRPKDSIRLIKFGLDTCESDWFDKMRAYETLGEIYENCEDYEAAKTAYVNYLYAIPEEQKELYIPTVSMDILRVELHLSNFEYTDYISELYQSVIMADSFEAEFRRFTFYRSIAEMIIAKKNADCSKQKEAYLSAMRALDGETVTAMDKLLRRHRYKDDARATRRAISFLKKNRA